MAYSKQLDEYLDQVEQILLLVAGEHRLRRTTIERWRWDEPVISLSWEGGDQISRNINALIIEDGTVFRLMVEANAWRDEDSSDGAKRVRRWHHAPIEVFVLPAEQSHLKAAAVQAYIKVAELSIEGLAQVHTVSDSN